MIADPARLWLRFGRFNLVGLMGAALQLLLIGLFMKRWRIPVLTATPIAVELVILHNFVWHERFTWSNRGAGGRLKRLGRFHAGNGAISLVGNTVLTYALVDLLRAPALVSSMIAIALCSVLNFAVADRWVYRTGRSEILRSFKWKTSRHARDEGLTPRPKSQQFGELFNSEIRVPYDSAEKWFFDRPARMNAYYGSSRPVRMNQNEVTSLTLPWNDGPSAGRYFSAGVTSVTGTSQCANRISKRRCSSRLYVS